MRRQLISISCTGSALNSCWKPDTHKKKNTFTDLFKAQWTPQLIRIWLLYEGVMLSTEDVFINIQYSVEECVDLCSLWHTADVTAVCLRVTLDFHFTSFLRLPHWHQRHERPRHLHHRPLFCSVFAGFSQGIRKVSSDQKSGAFVLGFSLCRVKVVVRMRSPRGEIKVCFYSFYFLWQIWLSRCHSGCGATRAVPPPGCSVWHLEK